MRGVWSVIHEYVGEHMPSLPLDLGILRFAFGATTVRSTHPRSEDDPADAEVKEFRALHALLHRPKVKT